MSSSEGRQDKGDEKCGQSETSATHRPEKPLKPSSSSSSSLTCDVWHANLLPPSQQPKAQPQRCRECQARMEGRWVTVCEQCDSNCCPRPEDWIQFPDYKCEECWSRDSVKPEHRPVRSTHDLMDVPRMRKTEKLVKKLSVSSQCCQQCSCPKPRAEFSPRQWKIGALSPSARNDDTVSTPTCCLSCSPVDQEWKQVIEEEWNKDGPVAGSLFRRSNVSVCDLPATLPSNVVMENRQARQHLRDQLIAGRVTHDVVFVQTREIVEEAEDSFFLQRTPGEHRTTLALGLVFDADSEHLLDLIPERCRDEQPFAWGHINTKDDKGESLMNFDFNFTSRLEHGEMTESMNSEAFEHRSMMDIRDMSLHIVSAPTSLPWIPADNVHPESRHAQHARGQLERWHANHESNDKEELPWLTRHKNVPQVVSQRVHAHATSERPCPQFELQKGDVCLKAAFGDDAEVGMLARRRRRVSDEGLCAWIARRRPTPDSS